MKAIKATYNRKKKEQHLELSTFFNVDKIKQIYIYISLQSSCLEIRTMCVFNIEDNI